VVAPEVFVGELIIGLAHSRRLAMIVGASTAMIAAEVGEILVSM